MEARDVTPLLVLEPCSINNDYRSATAVRVQLQVLLYKIEANLADKTHHASYFDARDLFYKYSLVLNVLVRVHTAVGAEGEMSTFTCPRIGRKHAIGQEEPITFIIRVTNVTKNVNQKLCFLDRAIFVPA